MKRLVVMLNTAVVFGPCHEAIVYLMTPGHGHATTPPGHHGSGILCGAQTAGVCVGVNEKKIYSARFCMQPLRPGAERAPWSDGRYLCRAD